jgi:hypothetical protein
MKMLDHRIHCALNDNSFVGVQSRQEGPPTV